MVTDFVSSGVNMITDHYYTTRYSLHNFMNLIIILWKLCFETYIVSTKSFLRKYGKKVSIKTYHKNYIAKELSVHLG